MVDTIVKYKTPARNKWEISGEIEKNNLRDTTQKSN